MKHAILAAILAAAVISVAMANESPRGHQATKADAPLAGTQSFAEDTARQRDRLDYLAAQIQSRADLDAYFRVTPKDKSPFRFLSDEGKKRFIDSMEFNENGLVSFDYSDLAAELRPTETLRILALFGAQRLANIIPSRRVESDEDKAIVSPKLKLMADHVDYKCESRASCYRRVNYICMSGC